MVNNYIFVFAGRGEGVVGRPYASVTLVLLHMSLTPIVVAVVAVCMPKSENKSSPNTRQTNIRPDTDSDSQMLR